MWYHHYLQHPEATRLEETLRATMTWEGLFKDVGRHAETCKSCHKKCDPSISTVNYLLKQPGLDRGPLYQFNQSICA